MNKTNASHLKLHREDDSGANQPKRSTIDSIAFDELQCAFAQATGWQFEVVESAVSKHFSGNNMTSYGEKPDDRPQLHLVESTRGEDLTNPALCPAIASEQAAERLLEQIEKLVRSLDQAETTVQSREAQLASTMTISIRAEDSEALAARMKDVLQRATLQTASDAAAVYLLDDDTTELKMRSCWGLPTSILSKPARPLRGALADLEALLGNAVLLENTSLAQQWNCPEDFPAALCLPIGSPSSPYGTLWLWSDHIRDFSTMDIEAAKAAADAVMADIQRCVMADELLRTRAASRHLESASLLQAAKLPTSQPLHRDYEIAGWTFQGSPLGGNFHNWTLNPHRQMAVVMGDAHLNGAAGAIVATSVETAVESMWNSRHDPQQLLRRTNDLLWATPEGDWRCSLVYFLLDPESGLGCLGNAGNIQTYLVNSRGYRVLGGTQTMLGEQPDTSFATERVRLEGGDLILMASGDLLSGLLHGGFTQTSLLNTVRQLQEEPVQEIVEHLARLLPIKSSGVEVELDRSLVLLRRRF